MYAVLMIVATSILLLVANGHQTGSNNHQNCINCTNADVRLRTPDDGQKGYPKHVIVIPIKLEFSASVGFIHNEPSDVYLVFETSSV